MSSSLEYRDKERQRKRESTRQASQAHREKERQRAIERRRNCSEEQRERERERDRERRRNFTDETSNARGSTRETAKQLENEREQENIDAELATNGEEGREKLQRETGVV